MRVLIIGGHGFVGRHLAHHLVSCGDDVALTYLPREKETLDQLKPALPKSAQSLALDITDAKAVGDLVALLKPDAIYHLAALTFIPEVESDFGTAFQVNTMGAIHVLDAVSKVSKDSRFLYVSSSEVYGDPKPGSLPLVESAVLRPVNTYGISKAAADLAAFKYAFHEGIHALRVRPFPHIGPGQSEKFSVSGFAKQVAEIKLGKATPKIQVGNLEAKRDFSDVSDIIRGYREVLLNGKRGDVYNLCSGKSTSVGDVLKKLVEMGGVEVEIEVDESRVRPIEVMESYGSSQKVQKEFGWKPRIELDSTLQSLLDFWLEHSS